MEERFTDSDGRVWIYTDKDIKSPVDLHYHNVKCAVCNTGYEHDNFKRDQYGNILWYNKQDKKFTPFCGPQCSTDFHEKILHKF